MYDIHEKVCIPSIIRLVVGRGVSFLPKPAWVSFVPLLCYVISDFMLQTFPEVPTVLTEWTRRYRFTRHKFYMSAFSCGRIFLFKLRLTFLYSKQVKISMEKIRMIYILLNQIRFQALLTLSRMYISIWCKFLDISSKIEFMKFTVCVIFWITFCVLTHSHTMTPFDAPGKQVFWKHYGKRRNCS